MNTLVFQGIALCTLIKENVQMEILGGQSLKHDYSENDIICNEM